MLEDMPFDFCNLVTKSVVRHFDLGDYGLEYMFQMGQLNFYGGEFAKPNYNKAYGAYVGAAEKGHALAQNSLGQYFRNHLKNDVEAVKWLKLSAEQNCGIAQDNLGNMYQLGRGVEKDLEEAFRWYKRSAENGCISGQNNLGFMYVTGTGVERSFKKAFDSYSESAGSGDAAGLIGLSAFYIGGHAVEKDVSKGVELLELAAIQDDGQASVDAAYRLGMMYLMFARNSMVFEEEVKAKKWLVHAAEKGHPGAIKAFNERWPKAS